VNSLVGVDTTFLIDLFRNNEKAIELLEGLGKSRERISTTVINLAELYRGAFLHPDMKAESAKYYGKIARDRDILIASIFLSFGEHRIITQDKKHFSEIHSLEVITY